nr:uncharacterized protein LOC113805698 [Penaeus vannamei]
MSWRHPRSKKWHQIDLILTRHKQLCSILNTRSYHSADCDTDDSLVCCKIRIQTKKLHRAKQPCKPHIDTSKTKWNTEQRWDHLHNTIHYTAFSVFGRKTGITENWFEVNATEISAVMERKRIALLNHSDRKETYCLAKSQAISNPVNVAGLRSSQKRGPADSQKLCQQKDKSTSKSKQMERWVEHYSDLYNRETIISDATLEYVERLPVRNELDKMPNLEELSRATDNLPSGKAPGLDGIPAEVIKSRKWPLLSHLHELLCQCWEEGKVPQDMRNCNIITLYKNKGDRRDCNNYRGISLLSKLQDKCREQNQPLYVAFIDLTKAFDLVSRDGLFKVLERIGCPERLLSIIQSFHEGM